MCSGWDLTALDSFILCVEYVPRSFCVGNCLWGKICSSYGMTETVQNMKSFDLCICCGLIKYCTYHVVLIPFEKVHKPCLCYKSNPNAWFTTAGNK